MYLFLNITGTKVFFSWIPTSGVVKSSLFKSKSESSLSEPKCEFSLSESKSESSLSESESSSRYGKTFVLSGSQIMGKHCSEVNFNLESIVQHTEISTDRNMKK